ncbi:hypothetical protein QGN23_01025 [Chryseobacterium gotjawalense]|uniref:Uncharacterized protein n=1 Tax=Chryseobacterium gotjawalense TaxID=3042315 RepID=A0ABY8RD26_9FLAO|nr:hypothetical protein [Chryseobacterium sp. wdc7]WHF51875.1 hypothetical protein QGN23_01025 [Chryseobacterium sp. wdc7]
MHTKSSLIDSLLRLTNNLLVELNSSVFHKKGQFSNPEKIKLEIVLSERELKLKNGYLPNGDNDNKKFADILNEWFADEKIFIDEVIPLLKALTPQHETKTKANNLAEIITHPNSTYIVESVKIQYKNIQGKRLKLLLTAIQELNLLPKERIAKKFHDYCKTEFNWNIASCTAMNDYVFNDVTDKDEVAEMKVFISNLTNTQ